MRESIGMLSGLNGPSPLHVPTIIIYHAGWQHLLPHLDDVVLEILDQREGEVLQLLGE